LAGGSAAGGVSGGRRRESLRARHFPSVDRTSALAGEHSSKDLVSLAILRHLSRDRVYETSPPIATSAAGREAQSQPVTSGHEAVRDPASVAAHNDRGTLFKRVKTADEARPL
jgi:hypothetical protein